MGKRLKRLILAIFSSVILIFLLLLSISFIHHQIQLSKEEELFVPTGDLVEVNGHKMHVYTEGRGEETLIFMSGGGTSSPVLDFKSLYSLLSAKYKIVVIEKSGYGFSEVTDFDRDIDTILSESREALLKLGVTGPYILVPHSMSGIEALRWAQVYTDEVKAIVGLDMAVPEAYEDSKINMFLIRISAFAANTGLTRWMTSLSESDAIKYGTLTEDEKELYKVIFYRRTLTKNMINEVKHIKANAQKVKEAGRLNVPILMFSSNGQGTGFKPDEWLDIQSTFASENDLTTLIKLDSSHYIHNIDYKKIAKEVEVFIRQINH